MCLGADCIEDCEVLRSGQTHEVLGHRVAAPSTLGTFLRAFTFGISASSIGCSLTVSRGAGAVDDNIWVVSADIGEALGQVMGAVGEIVQELSFLDAIQKRFGENQVVVVKLNRGDRLVLAEEVTR